MKGSEERDVIFGKLFGYISIIRSGILFKKDHSTSHKMAEDTKDGTTDLIDKMFDRLLHLYNMKSWIREPVIESLLSFINIIIAFDSTKSLSSLDKLQPLLSVSISSMSVSQLLLTLGLEQMLTAMTESKK